MRKPDASYDTPEAYIAVLDDDHKEMVSEIDKAILLINPAIQRRIWGSMGSQMIGYGEYHYKYASGREGDWFFIGLASQRNYVSVYLSAADEGDYDLAQANKSRLGKVSTGKCCIRIKKLEDVNFDVLTELIDTTINAMSKKYPTM